MIISHRHQFIFIKTKKTAGTSIEIALSKFCGPEDIITPITPEDEAIRRQLGYRGRQHFLAPLWNYTLRDFARAVKRRRPKLKYYNHMPASEVRSKIGPEIWDKYFKFCVERNPWDRVLSHYYWVHQTEPRPPLAEFVQSEVAAELKGGGSDLYTIEGEVAVDKIVRFEDLTNELEAIRLQLGLPEKLELPRAKGQFRKERQSYREVFGEAEKTRIASLFADEIRDFGYQF